MGAEESDRENSGTVLDRGYQSSAQLDRTGAPLHAGVMRRGDPCDLRITKFSCHQLVNMTGHFSGRYVMRCKHMLVAGERPTGNRDNRR